jgi:hypothetical protein
MLTSPYLLPFIIHLLQEGESPLIFDENLITYRWTVGVRYDFVTYLLSKCSGTNVLIYASSSEHHDISSELNLAIKSINKDIKTIDERIQFKNVKIIHKTDSSKRLVVSSDIFRSIINVYDSKSPDGIAFIDSVESLIGILGVVDRMKLLGITHTIQDGSIAVQARDIPPVNPQTQQTQQKLSDQWWYKWYMEVSSCAVGRVRQLQYGTCWFSSIMNILLLTPSIAGWLRYRWDNLLSIDTKNKVIYSDDADADACPLTKESLGKHLWSMVYMVLKLSYKVGRSVTNTSIPKAANTLLRTHHNDHNATNRNNTVSNLGRRLQSGYVPYLGVLMVLDSMKIPYRTIRNDQTSATSNMLTMTGPDDYELVFQSKPTVLQPFILTNNKALFVLDAASLQPTGQAHAVAGLTCAGRRYIFDSQTNKNEYFDWASSQNEYAYDFITYVKCVVCDNIENSLVLIEAGRPCRIIMSNEELHAAFSLLANKNTVSKVLLYDIDVLDKTRQFWVLCRGYQGRLSARFVYKNEVYLATRIDAYGTIGGGGKRGAAKKQRVRWISTGRTANVSVRSAATGKVRNVRRTVYRDEATGQTRYKAVVRSRNGTNRVTYKRFP